MFSASKVHPDGPYFWPFIYCVIATIGFYVIGQDIKFAFYERSNSLKWIEEHGQDCSILLPQNQHSYVSSKVGQLLQRGDPDGYAYLQSHNIPIAAVSSVEISRCEHLKPKAVPPFSSNLTGTPGILLNRTKLPTDAFMAVALSHELVHVRYGDNADARSHRGSISRLWLSEEGDAHKRGIQTAQNLHITHSVFASRFDEYRTFVYPIPIHAGFTAMFVFLAFLLGKVLSRFVFNRSPKSSTATQ